MTMKKIILFLLIFPRIISAQPEWSLQTIDFFDMPGLSGFGETMGVAVNSKQHIFVFHRGPSNLIEFDNKGNYVKTIGEGFFKKAHGLRIDAEDNIWITDTEQHIVLRFDPDGQRDLVLGRINRPGEWDDVYDIPLFNGPADVTIDKLGNIFVADGYGNSRIVKFDKNGNFIKTWGVKGSGKGEFNLPHNIVVDTQNRVLVADRENKRIQVFSTNGEFLEIWDDIGSPYGLCVGDNGIYMTDGLNNHISWIDEAGKIIAHFGNSGRAQGQFLMPHAITIDQQGRIFVADTHNWRVQCLIRH